jgi:hypothetical protein
MNQGDAATAAAASPVFHRSHATRVRGSPPEAHAASEKSATSTSATGPLIITANESSA